MRTSILLPAPWSIIRHQQKLVMQQLLHLHDKLLWKWVPAPSTHLTPEFQYLEYLELWFFSAKKQASLPTTYTTRKSINTKAQLHMRTLLQQSRRHDSWHWQDRGGRRLRGNKGVFYNNKSSNSFVKVVPYNKSSTGSTQLPSLAPSSMQLHHHLPYKCITIINAIIASPSTIQVHHLHQCNYCITIFNAIIASPSTIQVHHHLQCNCITIYNTFAITIYNTFASPSSLHLHHHHDIFLPPVPMNLSLSLSLQITFCNGNMRWGCLLGLE